MMTIPKRLVVAILGSVLLASALAAQTTTCTASCVVLPGSTFTVVFDPATTGAANTGHRLYLNGAQVGADIPAGTATVTVVKVAAPTTVGTHTLQAASFNANGETRGLPMELIVSPTPPPPPPIPPAATGTVGLTTVGTLQDTGMSHYLNGSKITLGAAGQISSVSVYVGVLDPLVANQRYQLALYTDVAGRPTNLMATTAIGQLVANAWNTLPIVAPPLPVGSYWLMFATNGSNDKVNNLSYNTGAAGAGAFSTGSVPFGTWPALFPQMTSTAFVYSLFGTMGANPDAPQNLRIM